MSGTDGATKVLDVKERFPANGTLADVTAWRVPQSDRYPEGVRYSMQYGRTDGRTIIRYLENRRFSTTRRNGDAVPRR
jgi:hypothetical protein